MVLKYFKLSEDITIRVYEKTEVILKKNTIFHIQSSYSSPTTGEEMVVIAIDKCTPFAVPAKTGFIME